MSGQRADRRIAWSAFGLAVLVFAPLAAFTDAPAPSITEHDPAAARALYRSMRAGEQVDAIVDYAITRTIAGQGGKFASSYTQAQWGHVTLTRSPDTLVIETPAHTYNCDSSGHTPSCAEGPPDRSLPRSEVFAVAVAADAYQVTRVPDRTIAGERAHCFRVRAVSALHLLPGIGEETTACFARAGVELSTRVVGPNATEARVAVRVRRDVDLAALQPVLAGYEKVAPKLSR